MNKIAFLCVTPLEGFLTYAFQSSVREYYQWLYEEALLKRIRIRCKKQIEVYGEKVENKVSQLFEPPADDLQLLYIQSHQNEVIKEVFKEADLVIMGISGCRKEFDKVFMPVFPWKDEVLFLWDQHICRGDEYIHRICNEYKLRAEQMIELKRNFYGKLKMRL